MRDNKAVAIICGVVIAGSVLAAGLSLVGGFGPPLDQAPFREAGRVLARQALAHLKPGGTVTVITRDTTSFENPASDILLETFRKELSKQSIRIESLQALQVDPLRLITVPAGDFCIWAKSCPKGSVIVSFIGPPVLSDTQVTQLGEIKPAVIALCSGPARSQADLRTLFAQGLLQGGVVSKRPVVVKPSPPATDQEAFEREFVEVTSANVAVLSGQSSNQ